MSSVFSEKAAVAAEKKAAAAAKQAARDAIAAEKKAAAAAKQAARDEKKALAAAAAAEKQAARDEKKAAAAALAAAKAALPKRPVGRPRKNTASVSDSVSVHSGPVLGPATVGLVTRTPTLAQLMAEIAELRTRLAAQTAAYTDVCGRLDTIRHTLMV
jgi:hypothetical protein